MPMHKLVRRLQHYCCAAKYFLSAHFSFQGTPRCTSERHTSWCPDDREILRAIEPTSLPGKSNISPVFSETTALVGIPKNIPVVYTSSVEQKVMKQLHSGIIMQL